MIDQQAWARLLAEAALGGDAQALQICHLCVRMLGINGAAVAVMTNVGNREVVCATDAVAARLEDLTVSLGEGPCFDAVHDGEPILIADMRKPRGDAASRWPAFVEGAAAVGACAVSVFPLQVGAISFGTLTMYRADPGDFSVEELSAALLAADAATLALLHVDMSRGDAFSNNLGVSPSYLDQVHQATGMVQVQLAVSTQEAFLILRARAFGSGRTVVDVASDVVEGRLRFTQDEQ